MKQSFKPIGKARKRSMLGCQRVLSRSVPTPVAEDLISKERAGFAFVFGVFSTRAHRDSFEMLVRDTRTKPFRLLVAEVPTANL